MHAYLLIGNGSKTNDIEDLAKKLNSKIFEFPLAKIEDVRNLNNLIRLSFNEPTLIVSKNIHEAGLEALNAFLKNLEEPQENVYFVLTAPSLKKVLPTIASRCQIIRIVSDKTQNAGEDTKMIEAFLNSSVGEKLLFIDRIKDRKKAVEFTENTVIFLHSQLHKNGVQYSSLAKNIEAVTQTLTRLKGNGNVNLQLTNLAIKYV